MAQLIPAVCWVNFPDVYCLTYVLVLCGGDASSMDSPMYPLESVDTSDCTECLKIIPVHASKITDLIRG